MKFIIHQHHHYGWTKNEHEAETLKEAMLLDILKYHPWLPEYEYSIKFDLDKERYSVTYEGETRSLPLGGYQYKGDYWFSDQIRKGEEDDCDACGGTGINHYYLSHQCWKCGGMDKEDRTGYKRGRSSGKIPD